MIRGVVSYLILHKIFPFFLPTKILHLATILRILSSEYLKMLNDKITIIVNLQYRKGFLYWCWKEKEWKYYIILSHLM